MNRSLSTALLLLAACGTNPIPDLADNEELYCDTGYACKLPGDRTVFLAPLGDARSATPAPSPTQDESGRPIEYDGDGRWDRPVVEMVDAVLRREVEASLVFAATCTEPVAADIVITPSLVTFATAAIEHEYGGCGLAEVAVRVLAYGPMAGGQRPLLLDEVFADRKLTDVSFRTPSRYRLAGAATRAAMQRLLQGLDSKNVGRNGMPVAPDTAIPGIPVAPAPAPAPTGQVPTGQVPAGTVPAGPAPATPGMGGR